ncbi:MAG: S-methyl-5-thioribose-1-phosphate isomerase [Leptospiraceae bacterium]|nr:S-methyl-5-thioribose-1-phosphate isomerase [Leptospiraceae bacterium]
MELKYKAYGLNSENDLIVLDQRRLPHAREFVTIRTAPQAAEAIRDMTVRGAGTLAAVAAFGVYLSSREHQGRTRLVMPEIRELEHARPTAVNLRWAVQRMLRRLAEYEGAEHTRAALEEAIAISDEDVIKTRRIGQFGFELMREVQEHHGTGEIQVLTHCNAGWLGISDLGTALAPVYLAHQAGMRVHVWVEETRPRNQGALTAWELAKAGIPCTYIVDNAGGLVMQQGKVHIVFVGADRVSQNGDVANKIGTYQKALAAFDNNIPFYVNLPIASIDFELQSGSDIPIETRSDAEIRCVSGIVSEPEQVQGAQGRVQIFSAEQMVYNPGFDITPARLVSGLITEAGVIPARTAEIMSLARQP